MGSPEVWAPGIRSGEPRWGFVLLSRVVFSPLWAPGEAQSLGAVDLPAHLEGTSGAALVPPWGRRGLIFQELQGEVESGLGNWGMVRAGAPRVPGNGGMGLEPLKFPGKQEWDWSLPLPGKGGMDGDGAP